MSAPLLLLPPSEGKAPGGDGPAWSPADGTFPALAGARQEVARALVAAGGGDAALLGVGGRHLERAQEANRLLLDGPPTLPAWRRYTGVVHDHLDVGSLARGARAKALDTVVVSGLLGLVALGDPVPDYRLKVGARLPALGGLAAWWRPQLTAALADHAGGRVIVDLLPGEHAAALDLTAIATRADAVLRVRLLEPDGRAGGHDAKAAKGRLARHLLTSRAAPERALRTFDDERYAVEIATVTPDGVGPWRPVTRRATTARQAATR